MLDPLLFVIDTIEVGPMGTASAGTSLHVQLLAIPATRMTETAQSPLVMKEDDLYPGNTLSTYDRLRCFADANIHQN